MPSIKPIIPYALLFGLYVCVGGYIVSAVLDAVGAVFGIDFLRSDPVPVALGGFILGLVLGVVTKLLTRRT